MTYQVCGISLTGSLRQYPRQNRIVQTNTRTPYPIPANASIRHRLSLAVAHVTVANDHPKPGERFGVDIRVTWAGNFEDYLLLPPGQSDYPPGVKIQPPSVRHP